MSMEAGFNLSTAVQGLSIQPISDAAESILQDLTPLLSKGSTLNPNATEKIRNIVDRIVRATELTFAATQHSAPALLEICRTLRKWEVEPPSLKLISLKMICRGFQYAHANAKDAFSAFEDMKIHVETLFNSFADSYGSEVVVEVTSIREYTGELNLKKSSIQALGTNAIWHIEQCAPAAKSLADLLAGINSLLRSFCEDGQISLIQHLATIPVWSANPIEIWSALDECIKRFSLKVSGTINSYKEWFEWTSPQQLDLLREDRTNRASQISLPNINLHVPKDEDAPTFRPEWPYTTVPSQILQAQLKGSGSCTMKLLSVNRVRSDVSSVTLSFNLRGSVDRSLECVDILCTTDTAAPARVLDHHPKELTDVLHGSQAKFTRTARLAVITDQPGSVRWKLSQPLVRWRTLALPTSFNISVDLEYPVETRIHIILVLVYRQRFFNSSREVTTQHATVNIGRGTPSESKNDV